MSFVPVFHGGGGKMFIRHWETTKKVGVVCLAQKTKKEGGVLLLGSGWTKGEGGGTCQFDLGASQVK